MYHANEGSALNISIDPLEQWGIEAQLKGLSVEEEVAFFKEKIKQLRNN